MEVATTESTAEAETPAPTAEQTPEATTEATPEATIEAATSEPTAEQTPEATVEATLEPAADVFALGAASASEECTHAHRWSKEERVDVEYSNPTAEGHTVSYYSTIHHTCADCGKTWSDEPSAERKTVQEMHNLGSGICERCGYVCPHSNVAVWKETDYDNDTYTSLDAYTHLHSYTFIESYHCSDCQESWEGSDVQVASKKEMHNWNDDGTCLCGASNTCTHPNKVLLHEIVHADDGGYVDNGETSHTATSGVMSQEWFCYDCIQSILVRVPLPGTGVQELHDYYDGVCTKCGHKLSCTHENSYVVSKDVESWEDVRQEGDSGHTFVNSVICIDYTCNDCRVDWYEYEWGKDYFEPHDFSWGKRCSVCGYDTKCTHPNVKQEAYYNVADTDSYENAGAEGHYVICTGTVNYYCSDCGVQWWKSDEVPVRTLIPHELYGGRCVCGYESHCSHENLAFYDEVYGDLEGSGDFYVNPDAEGHTHIKVADCFMQCTDCGEIFYDAPEWEISSREPHAFVDGKCKWCNYVYVEPTATPVPTLTPAPTATAAPSAEPTAPVETNEPEVTPEPTMPAVTDEPVVTPAPTATAAPSVEPTAPVETNEPNVTPEPTMPAVTDEPVVTPEPTATAAPSAEPTAPAETDEPVVTPEPTMPAVTDTPIATPTAEATAKPTAKPTAAPTKKPVAAPTAKPAPVYTQLPENETLHGVKVEDAPNLLEAISVVAEALENQGTSVQVRLLKIDKVLTKEEMAKLTALPLKEQIFTVISVIGFEDAVSRTLEAEGQALSADAQALKEEIQARVAAMTEAEYAEFEAMLLESFPQETVVIDGVEYTFFTLELEVREGDTVRYERYGFRLEGEEWILTRLEVA